MDPIIGGALVGGAFDMIGGIFGGESNKKAAAANAALQREFAQNSIQWKVADAKAAGVHPLYALGAPTYSANPVYAGDSSLGSSFSSMGQHLGRAVEASMTKQQRLEEQAKQARMDELKLRNAELQNDLLSSQIATTNAQLGPSFPSVMGNRIPGQGDSGLVVVKPSELTSSRKGEPSLEAAPPAPAVKLFKNADGTVSVWPSADAKQSIEDSLYEYEHMYRNRIVPWVQRQKSDLSHWYNKHFGNN